jgi:hypothetical protein
LEGTGRWAGRLGKFVSLCHPAVEFSDSQVQSVGELFAPEPYAQWDDLDFELIKFIRGEITGTISNDVDTGHYVALLASDLSVGST